MHWIDSPDAPFADVEDECHRSVIEQGDLHQGSECTAFGVEPRVGERLNDRRYQVLGIAGLGRSGETGSSAPAKICRKGELGNHEDGTPNIGERSVHLPLVIGKYPQTGNLVDEGNGIGCEIGSNDRHEHEESVSDRRHLLAADGHLCMANPLNHSAHLNSPRGGTEPTLAAMILNIVLSSVRGFAMGAADIVPGVSGGTIALVLGIYERLVHSVKAGSSALGHLLKGDIGGFRRWMRAVDWIFILPLGFGILLAVVTLAHLIESLLVDQPILMASIFLGLVAGSVVVAFRLIRMPKALHIWIMVAVGIVVFILLGLRGGTTEDSVRQILDPSLWAFFGAGAIAICAMILPGISGSFLLVVLGMYGPLLAAVTDRDLAALATFIVGAVVGLALFSQILDRALRSHHDVVLATLIGLMAGSVRVLWPWPLGVNSTDLGAPDGDVLISVVAALIGFAFVVVVARSAQNLESSSDTAAVAD